MARQKVGVACDRCRLRKIKCDAKKPHCSPCITREDPSCTYSGYDNYRSSQRRRQELCRHTPSRAHEHTSQMQKNSAKRRTERNSPMIPPIGRQLAASPSSPTRDDLMHAGPQSISIPSSTPMPRTPAKNTLNQHIDAMTGVGRDQSSIMEFFGGSSAISFTAQINSAIDAHLNQSSRGGNKDNSTTYEAQRHDGSALDASGGTPVDSIDPLALSLPPKTFSDSLVQDYFDLVWNVLPIHDWPTFKHDYESVWLGNPTKTPTRPLYCLVNTILALGSQFSQAIQPAERERMGEAFLERALTLFDPRLQENASVEATQCLLLMGLFLQSTNHSHQCWMVVGSAVRMAQTLGLHLPQTTNLHTDRPHDTELTRRIWHGCVFMDRVMSMTFGRPSMIANWLYEAVPLPSMIEDDVLLKDTVRDLVASNYGPPVQTRSTVPIIGFFIKSVELYSIVNDSLLELYMQQRDDQNGHASEHLSAVLQLDEKLSRWAQSIPDGLRYSSAANDNFVIQRQRVNLRARYLHARILILRPLLADACLKQVRADVFDMTFSTSPDNNNGGNDGRLLADRFISNEIISHCSSICSDSAHELINIVYENLDLETVTGPVPAWWFAVLFVYTAATVLLAERFRHLKSPGERLEKNLSTNTVSMERTWDQAMQILQAYAKVGGSARRCVAALEILQAKIRQHSRPSATETQVLQSNNDYRADVSGSFSIDHAHQHQQQHVDKVYASDRLLNSLRDNTSASERASAAAMPLHLPADDDFGQMVDLRGIDFDIDNMLWLNTSAADIFS